MSGSLATGLGLYNAVSGLLAGPAVTIGNVGLSGLEVPASMPFGGEQAMKVHQLVGGGRQVDVFGAVEADIEWSGFFTGPTAVARARMLDSIRMAGAQVTLTWADFTRKVVVRTFKADYSRAGAVIPYKVVCVVVTTQSVAAQPTLLSSIAGDISSALGLSGLAASAQSALTTAQAALPVVSTLVAGSPAAVALAAPVTAASTSVTAAQTTADAATAAGGHQGGCDRPGVRRPERIAGSTGGHGPSVSRSPGGRVYRTCRQEPGGLSPWHPLFRYPRRTCPSSTSPTGRGETPLHGWPWPTPTVCGDHGYRQG